MIGWFANAIEHSSHIRRCRAAAQVLPADPQPETTAALKSNADLLEQVDRADLKPAAQGRDGSSPSVGTTPPVWFCDAWNKFSEQQRRELTDAFALRPPAAVVDHTERAREIVDSVEWQQWICRDKAHSVLAGMIAAALSAVASERDAALKSRDKAWNRSAAYATEIARRDGVIRDIQAERDAEIAALKHDIARTQAAASSEAEAHSALLARLGEPDVREALIATIRDFILPQEPLGALRCRDAADAALTRITEMLK